MRAWTTACLWKLSHKQIVLKPTNTCLGMGISSRRAFVTGAAATAVAWKLGVLPAGRKRQAPPQTAFKAVPRFTPNYRQMLGLEVPKASEELMLGLLKRWKQIEQIHDIGAPALVSDRDKLVYSQKFAGKEVQLVIPQHKMFNCVRCHKRPGQRIQENFFRSLERQARELESFWGEHPQNFLPERVFLVLRKGLRQTDSRITVAASNAARRAIIVTPYALLREKLLQQGTLAHEFDHLLGEMEAHCKEVWAYFFNARKTAHYFLQIDENHSLAAVKDAVQAYVSSDMKDDLDAMVDFQPGYRQYSERYDLLNGKITENVRQLDELMKQARKEYNRHLNYWDTWINRTGYAELPVDVFVAKRYSTEHDFKSDERRGRAVAIASRVMRDYLGEREAIERKLPEGRISVNAKTTLKSNVLQNLENNGFSKEEALKGWYALLKEKFFEGQEIKHDNVSPVHLLTTIIEKSKALVDILDKEKAHLDDASAQRIIQRVNALNEEARGAPTTLIKPP